jgi:hypothetical protein
MHRRSKTVVLLTLSLALVLAGCVSEEDKGANASGSSSSGGSSGTTTGGGLYLKVESAYDMTPDDKTVQANCSIPLDSAAGTTDTCTVTMPEADLYFGRLTFTYGTGDPDQCAVVNFKPYYYQGSSAANFDAIYKLDYDPASPTDCSASPISSDCFNGVAVQIVPDFPSKRYLYIETSAALESTVEAPSANELDLSSNAYSSNNMSAANRTSDQWDPTSIVGGTTGSDNKTYLANTLQDYTVECRDVKYELIYQITLTVNSTPGSTISIPDWDDAGL